LFDSWTDQFARHAVDDWLVIWDLLKPVVCKVHGACLAGGAELMSLCDVVFAADDARIGYPPMRAQSTPDTVFFPWKMSMAQAKYRSRATRSTAGRHAKWAGCKSFPADQLDGQVAKEVAALASIPPDLLAANKLALNHVYEMMGFRTALKAGVPWHTLSSKYRPSAGEFRRIAEEKGLKEAIRWRDGAFKDLGG
jgi:enoyl-CoA hydratase